MSVSGHADTGMCLCEQVYRGFKLGLGENPTMHARDSREGIEGLIVLMILRVVNLSIALMMYTLVHVQVVLDWLLENY